MALTHEPNLHRFTVDSFLVVAESIDEKVELIDGVIYDVGEETADHARLVMAVVRAVMLMKPQVEVLAGGTVRLEPWGAPIPDVAVYRHGADTSSRYFQASDLLLAVEVSLSAANRDRAKLCDYARAGIPEVWILDRPGPWDGDLRVRSYCEPDRTEGSYGTVVMHWWELSLDAPEWIPTIVSWIATF